MDSTKASRNKDLGTVDKDEVDSFGNDKVNNPCFSVGWALKEDWASK